MKKIKLITILTGLIIFTVMACEKSELSTNKIIEGTYVGTITEINGESNRAFINTEGEALAEITRMGNETIEVHLNSVELDTTFTLNYYEDMDIVNVCFTGDDFENTYGHMLGQDHMSGGMMNDIQNNETEWMHHLNDEHQEGDEHFGGFDMQNHTFSYQFTIMEDGLTHDLLFQGGK